MSILQAVAKLRRWELTNPRSERCTAHDVLDHIEHVIKIAGVDHVGLGSDYDGVSVLPKQLSDVSCYPVLTQELLDRGYDAGKIRKILGENVMRVFREVEKVANHQGR